MIKKIVILIIMLADCTSKSYCQDPQFSQYYANQLYLSPSYAGSTDGCRVISNFRDQWLKIPGSFITYSCSFDYFLYKLNSGVGFLFLSDQAGSGRLRTTNLGFQYSYNIHIKKDWVIRPGLQYYYTQRSFDLSKLIFVDQVSIHGMSPGTSESFPVQKVDYFDCSASVIGYSENKWAGFTIDHLVKNNQSFLGKKSSVPVKYSLFGGFKINIKGKSKRPGEESLYLSYLYKRQKDFNQFEITPYWSKAPFILGIGYRGCPHILNKENGFLQSDAIIFLIGYKVEYFSIGYSYDFTISSLAGNTAGAHEISIIYLFNQEHKYKVKKMIVPCPKF